jgi:hypothetical protein
MLLACLGILFVAVAARADSSLPIAATPDGKSSIYTDPKRWEENCRARFAEFLRGPGKVTGLFDVSLKAYRSVPDGSPVVELHADAYVGESGVLAVARMRPLELEGWIAPDDFHLVPDPHPNRNRLHFENRFGFFRIFCLYDDDRSALVAALQKTLTGCSGSEPRWIPPERSSRPRRNR